MPAVWKDSVLFNSMETLLEVYVLRKQRLSYGIDNMNFTAISKGSFWK